MYLFFTDTFRDLPKSHIPEGKLGAFDQIRVDGGDSPTRIKTI